MMLLIEPTHPDFIQPIRGTEDSAGIDFHALDNGYIKAGEIVTIPLGCKVAFPPNVAMLLSTRSGHGRKYGAGVPHGYGLIDSDYRGELVLVLTTKKDFPFVKGARIAQAIFVPIERPTIQLVNQVPPSARGEGGFGSTGN